MTKIAVDDFVKREEWAARVRAASVDLGAQRRREIEALEARDAALVAGDGVGAEKHRLEAETARAAGDAATLLSEEPFELEVRDMTSEELEDHVAGISACTGETEQAIRARLDAVDVNYEQRYAEHAQRCAALSASILAAREELGRCKALQASPPQGS